MDCSTLAERLDDQLDREAYTDIDASANGIQIGPESQDVQRVAFAVDAAVETIAEAAERGADMLVTHHGISWGGIERVTGREYERIATALDNDIVLYTAHLPLDGHQELGNAAGIAELFNLENRTPFGTHGGEYIGQQGTVPGGMGLDEMCQTLADELDTGGQGVQLFDFGPEIVETVAIVTGSGVDWLDEAVESGADVLVTGEGKQHVYHEARESGINVVLAGHYATETFGVERLQELADGWGTETTYIDHPTGI